MQTCAEGWSEPGARPRLDLAPGDALNGEGEMIAANLGGSADETIGAICGALAAFTGGAEPADDVTVVVRRG